MHKAKLLLLLPAVCMLLGGTSCTLRKRLAPAPVVDTRPEPRLKKSPYTVRGKRYYPLNLQKALEYREVGVASIYEGADTIGAMGERLRYGAKYAAHRTLPLPSSVRITSIATGKSCVVRVNDRGPFHPKRIIDISPAVARELGFHRRGLLQVEVETVSVGDGPNKRIRPNE